CTCPRTRRCRGCRRRGRGGRTRCAAGRGVRGRRSGGGSWRIGRAWGSRWIRESRGRVCARAASVGVDELVALDADGPGLAAGLPERALDGPVVGPGAGEDAAVGIVEGALAVAHPLVPFPFVALAAGPRHRT